MSILQQSTVMIEEQTFSDCFWRFVKEKCGVSRIYPSANQRSKNKKVLSMEQRQERINVMLQKVEFDDDKLSTGDAVLA